MKFYTSTILSVAITACSVFATYAQAPAEATPEVTEEQLASRKASIPVIEARIEHREAEIQTLLQEIERSNDRIEGRIDKIVDTLSKMKDSHDSRVQVAHLKEQTMKGLARTIGNYKRRRAELKEQLRSGNPDIGEEAAKKGVALMDAKIEKRANQLITLSKSFTKNVDYEKYENDDSEVDSLYDWGWNNTRTNEDWKQNRREVVFTDAQQKKMISALKESIEDLSSRNKTLENKLAQKNISEEAKAFYQDDIARNNSALKSRRKQLEEIMQPSAPAPTTSVSSKQAHETKLMVQEIAKDIKRDTAALIGLYNHLKSDLASLNKIKKNLAARKAWLEEHSSK